MTTGPRHHRNIHSSTGVDGQAIYILKTVLNFTVQLLF